MAGATTLPCPSHPFTTVAVSLGTTSVNGVRNSVGFVEENICTDLDAMQEMVEINSQSTPTSVIDGEVIIGSDKEKPNAMLGSSTTGSKRFLVPEGPFGAATQVAAPALQELA